MLAPFLLLCTARSVVMVRGWQQAALVGRRRLATATRRCGAPSSVTAELDPGVIAGLSIVKYPHPALRATNEEIPETDLRATQDLARRMFDLMYETKGVGLAAPQVAINKRLMVFNPSGAKEKWLDEVVLVNPRIVARSEGTVSDTEACLSFPDMQGDVDRAKWIKIEAVTPTGRQIKKKLTGWVARIFQHEYDHLDGIVYTDHVKGTEKEEIQEKLDALVEAYGEGAAL